MKTFQNKEAAENAKSIQVEEPKGIPVEEPKGIPVEEPKVIPVEEQKAESPKRKTVNMQLSTSAEAWDFEANPEFIGTFTGEMLVFPSSHEKAGQEFGYVFEDDLDEKFSIGMSHLINKAMNAIVEGVTVKDLKKPYIHIIFKGQKAKADGQKFNDFDIKLLSYEE